MSSQILAGRFRGTVTIYERTQHHEVKLGCSSIQCEHARFMRGATRHALLARGPLLAAPGRSLRKHAVVAARLGHHVFTAEAAPTTRPLSQLQLCPIIDTQGYISPVIPDGTQATVFAIFDDREKLQYVGFSKDLRNTLRTVLGRRPDKAYFYKANHLQSVDQAGMIRIRDDWFVECGGPPPGNKVAMERRDWQQPVDAGAISQRGKLGAAEEQCRQLLEALRSRGCKEEFVPNQELLAEGQVDFLVAAAASEEELAARAAAVKALAKAKRTAITVVDGVQKKFDVTYLRSFPTRGGYMMDVRVSYEQQESKHRIIVGKDYYEPHSITPEAVVEAALSLLLVKKVPRQTEGLLMNSQFPSNYFSISELEQWFGEDFNEEFERSIGVHREETEDYWRFNRVFGYGAQLEQNNMGDQDPSAAAAARAE